jgi:hypothetical protein
MSGIPPSAGFAALLQSGASFRAVDFCPTRCEMFNFGNAQVSGST